MMPHAYARIALLVPFVGFLAVCTGDANAPRAASGPGYVVEGGTVQPVNHLPNPYETVRDWGTIPAGRVWGSVSALQVDIDGRHIWVADRCGANSCAGSTVDPILKLDPDGNVVTSFGAETVMWPHGMHVDEEGNVWIADAKGARPAELEQFPRAAGLGHRVIKFSPEGEILLTIGIAGEPGDPPTHLTEPNDVITAPNGDIFVAESHSGQSNSATPDTPARISKYSADGTFIRSWGTWGSGPRRVQDTARPGLGLTGSAVRLGPWKQQNPDLRPGRQLPRRVVPVQPHQRPSHRSGRYPLRHRLGIEPAEK